MKRLDCPLCGQSVEGLVITFPSQTARQQIEQTFASDFGSMWRTIAEDQTWVQTRFLYDCLPYWQEFYDITMWQPVWADLAPDGILSLREPATWEELVRLTPQLFVENIIRSGQIRMMMQPIVDVKNARTFGYEMLVRGLGDDDAIISPGELYASAREQNQLFRLDRACRIAAIEAANQLPKEVHIFINFIPTSIYVPEHCLTTTIAAVDRLGIARDRIVFEVVESDEVKDLNHLRTILEYYRKMGFHCALDDFGAGFNNLDTMNALQPDVVKLDRTYVTDIHLDSHKQHMAKQVYEQGAAAGAVMLAEGIECEEEACTLASLGFHLQQGYWYGRPSWNPVQVSTAQLNRVSTFC